MAATVLVVDDLEPNVRLLEAKLKSEFYEVMTANSGVDALNKVKQKIPDVILLDVMMPEMDGFEACKRLKADPHTSNIPVVMVTALTDMQDRVQGLSVGADDFLTKPVNDMALFARIRSLVRLKNMTDELRLRDKTGAEYGGDTKLQDKLNDVSGAKVLLVEDDQAQSMQIVSTLKSVKMIPEAFTVPAEAVRRSEAENFDIIIVDSQLSGSDGLHLCQHFRTQDATRNIPILILIEEDNTDLLVKALDMGISDYIMSPIDQSEVLARSKTQVKRKRYQDALKQNYQRSLSMAVTDELTGLYNRYYLTSHLTNLLQQVKVSGKKMALIIMDIDHFKMVNDTYGHLAGDEILKQVSRRIVQNVRPTDLVARYGGEEFVIVLPDTSVNQGAVIAERVRSAMEAEVFNIPVEPGQLAKTISLGVTVANSGDSPEQVISRADKALYHVKNTGRNRVAVYTEPEK